MMWLRKIGVLVLSLTMCKMISFVEFLCEYSKEAWDTLETINEETKGVKSSELQVLTSRFDEIKMKEDETFGEF